MLCFMHKKERFVCGIEQIPFLFSHKKSQESSHIIYLGCSNNSFSHLYLNLPYLSHFQYKSKAKKHFEFSLLTLSSEDFVFISINMYAALER